MTKENYLEEKQVERKEVFVNDSTVDIISLYLQEIDKFPLLTKEEERELAKRMKEGDKEAKELFTNSNLRLVVSRVKKQLGKGLSFMDLIQEGNLGLLKAIEKYDYTLGFKFGTYAVYSIDEEMTRAIENLARTIRIPVGIQENIFKLVKVRGDLRKAFEREPSVEEIAFAMKNIETIENELEKKLKRNPNEKEIEKAIEKHIKKVKELIYLSTSDAISYETPIGDESEGGDKTATILDTIEDDSFNTYNTVEENNLKSNISIILETLEPIQREVIIHRFGLNGEELLTVKKLSEKLNLEENEVKSIEKKAKQKMLVKAEELNLREFILN